MGQIEEYSDEGSIMQTIDCRDSDEFDKSIAKGGVNTPFPWKLHNMLDDMARKGEHSLVTWQPHGRAFMVLKPKEFTSSIMPHYFNQTKYASFQRQLNLYGFSRLSHGRDKGAYYHMCFVRGERELCRHMVRQKIKGTKVRRSLSPEEEPNFYLPHWATTEGLVVDGVTLTTEHVKNVIPAEDLPPVPIPKVSPAPKRKTKAISKETAPMPAPAPSLVSMMRDTPKNQSHQRTTLPPPPTIRKPRTVSSSTESQGPSSMPLAGDLLFFEGRPFRYLEHLEELPVIPPPQIPRKQKEQLYKHKLHSMINSIVTESATWHETSHQNVCSV